MNLAGLREMLRTPISVSLAALMTALPVAMLSGCSMLRQGAPEATSAPVQIALPSVTASVSAVTPTAARLADSPLAAGVADEPSGLSSLAAPQLAPTESRTEEAPGASHIVKAGETLTRIADRYGVSIASILQANDLVNPDHLEIGQILQLPQTPVDYTPSLRILPDSRLVRSIGASGFDIEGFIQSQNSALRAMSASLQLRDSRGRARTQEYPASEIIKRVSLEYSVDARILLAFLEYIAGLVTNSAVEIEAQQYPLRAREETPGLDRPGLYRQLSWLADTLNRGYYDWKYRGVTILEMPAGDRIFYEPSLNAGSVAVQFALAQMRSREAWERDIGETGLVLTYRRLFGDPFTEAHRTVPGDVTQPTLTLPFAKGEVWRFTGGFHGGWGNGSAWAAVDFSPPAEEGGAGTCYVSSFPVTAVARGSIARLDDGLVVLDLDLDGDESSGWSILYLHLDRHDSLRVGQIVELGNILGYPSCAGGFSSATHLHIARRYNGEWLPADCNRCPAGRDVPPFVMSHWRVVGLGSQLYQGFMVNALDNRSAVAEQGRFTNINEITW